MIDDPVAFIEKTLVNPETTRPFVLTDAERVFLRHAFELTPAGRLKYSELLFSAPKKSGKTAFAAMILIYMVRVAGGRFCGRICARQFVRSSLAACVSGGGAHCAG